MTLKLLDLFCGQGGAAMGYIRAGFDVTGVDNQNHGRRYPGRFVQADALDFLANNGDSFDVIHASPPCQRYTHGNVAGLQAYAHPDLVPATREALIAWASNHGKPWVIENVPRAPLIKPIVLCGSMFNLRAIDDDGTELVLRRHRLFESNYAIAAPRACRHRAGEQVAGCYGGARRDKYEARYERHGGYVPSNEIQQILMGIDWMTNKAMQQAIPPVYAQCLGSQLRKLCGKETRE